MKAKKLLVGLFSVLLSVSIVTGCSSKEKEGKVNGKKIDKIDAVINSFKVLDREIYLTENLEDFVLQFQGMNCKFYPDNSYNAYSDKDPEGTIAIDNIKSKDNPFYSASGDQYVDVVCSIPNEEKEKAIVGLQLSNNDNESYVNRPIASWIAKDNIQIGEKDNIIYVDCKNNHSEIKDIERIYGANNEKEMDLIHKDEVDSVIYKAENNLYQIDFKITYPTFSKEYEHKVLSVWVKKQR